MQVTAETAPHMNFKLIAEGANGPTDLEGEAIMLEKGCLFLELSRPLARPPGAWGLEVGGCDGFGLEY